MVSIKSIFENPDAEKIDKEDLSAVKNRIRDLWNSQKNAVNNVGSAEDTALFHIVSMLLSADKNCAFSPTSLLCALLFLGRLTEGTCQKEIYDTLFCTPETAEQMYRNIMDSTTGHSGIASSTIVASLWSNHNYPLKERELYKICEQYGVDAYSGKMGSADMNLALQGWVNRHTGRMLTSYTSGMKIDSLSVLELIIAACFKAAWEVPFWERQTKCGDFHIDNNQTVPCMFMNGKEKNRCYRGKMFAAAVKELQLD